MILVNCFVVIFWISSNDLSISRYFKSLAQLEAQSPLHGFSSCSTRILWMRLFWSSPKMYLRNRSRIFEMWKLAGMWPGIAGNGTPLWCFEKPPQEPLLYSLKLPEFCFFEIIIAFTGIENATPKHYVQKNYATLKIVFAQGKAVQFVKYLVDYPYWLSFHFLYINHIVSFTRNHKTKIFLFICFVHLHQSLISFK